MGTLILAGAVHAGPFSVKVFNPDGSAITSTSVTLHVYNSATPAALVGTYKTTNGVFTQFTIAGSALPADKTLRFDFTRQNVGTTTHTIIGLFGNTTAVQAIDAIVPLTAPSE